MLAVRACQLEAPLLEAGRLITRSLTGHTLSSRDDHHGEASLLQSLQQRLSSKTIHSAEAGDLSLETSSESIIRSKLHQFLSSYATSETVIDVPYKQLNPQDFDSNSLVSSNNAGTEAALAIPGYPDKSNLIVLAALSLHFTTNFL